MITFTQDFLLEQIITEPTRGDNILDLCFVLHPNCIQHYKIAPGLSDHDAVILDMYHHAGHNVKLKKKIYCYRKADWASLRIELENITTTYFQLNEANSRSIQDNRDYFHNLLLQAIDAHIPVKSISNAKSPPRITSQLKRLIRKKQCLYNKAKASKTTLDWTAYKIIQRQVCQSMRAQHNDYFTDLLNSSSRLNGNKPFWHYIKSRRQEHIGISALETLEGTVTSATSKAETLNKAFKSVFTIEDLHSLPFLPDSTHPTMQDICITKLGVYNILSQLDPHKAEGPDGIPACVLKELAFDLAPIFTHLYQQSLNTGTLPEEWKSAFITPVFKKGKRSDPLNYRPISLTSIVCKIFEHIVASQVTNHLETNNILCNNQFEFRTGHSCESQLLLTIDDFACALNNKLQVDIGILDLSKAFDKVPHVKLLKKLGLEEVYCSGSSHF